MLRARTDEECRWVQEFAAMMTGTYNGDIQFREIVDVYGPASVSTVTTPDELYFVRDWDNWMKYMALERRLRHGVYRTESVFVWWHNVEMFAMPAHHRGDLYARCPAWFFTGI